MIEFTGQNQSERGLAQPGRTAEQGVVDRLAPSSRGLDEDPEVVFDALLADEVVELRRTKASVEHPIFGPKIVNLSWDTETRGKVWVAGFPMDQMPVQMREAFVAKLAAAFGEARERHDVGGRVVIEVVDEATGSVMEAIEG